MSAHDGEQALAQMLGALVREHETADVLSELVHECATSLPADAAALLVTNGRGSLELLSATSHRASELEVYQAQHRSGPCVDVLRHGDRVVAVGADDIITRWPDVGTVIVESGFQAVHALPMTWHGRVLGGLNVFSAEAVPLEGASLQLAQNFADVASIALAQPGMLEDDELDARISAALEGRVVIEQAKGVLAHTLGVDMAAAYDELLRRTLDTRSTLSTTAREVIREAHGR